MTEPRLRARLVGPDGMATEHQLDADRDHTVGRDASCDLVITDQRVSRRHATIDCRGQTWWFRDHSRLGSFAEGLPIDERAITGDLTVRLGDPALGPVLDLTVESDESIESGEPVASAPAPVGRPGPVEARTTLRVGRAPDNDVVVNDLTVSRHHAELRPEGAGWRVIDLGSDNGTFVQGRRVHDQVAAVGARLALGSQLFVLTADALAPQPASTAALEADGVWVVTRRQEPLLVDVSVAVAKSQFVAVVGPTGAGKSTLLRVLTGAQLPARGAVLIDGRDLYTCFDELQGQIGYVPQDDIVHRQLTARQALGFGAELRFPADVSPTDRVERISSILDSLGLSAHADRAIDRLSGGQRKRVSVALELLTEPALLFLDEPTSGLDPGYEQSIMQLLAGLARRGRTVVVVTHSVASLHLCDKVVFLAAGGRVSFTGLPAEALDHYGAPDFPEVFRRLEAEGQRRDGEPRPVPPPQPAPAEPADGPLTPRTVERPRPRAGVVMTQTLTLCRRAITILGSDRRNLLVLGITAVVPGALLALLVGHHALAAGPTPNTSARNLLSGIVVSACVIGIANGVREIVKEQAIYHRERSIGLAREAYLLSKTVVLGVLTTAQSTILVLIAVSGAGGPVSSNLLPPIVEILVATCLAAVVSMCGGLLISAIVNTSEKALALVPVAFVVLWLFSGAIAALASKPVLQDAAYLAPSNWGLAAVASTADLPGLEQCGSAATSAPRVPRAPASTTSHPHCDARWQPGTSTWLGSMTALVLLGLGFLLAADWALARTEVLPEHRRHYLVADAARATKRALARGEPREGP